MKKMRPDFIGHYTDFEQPDDAHYPGSNEILAQGYPVGKKLGLKKIGIHIEVIAPGRRTSWPHAEKEEEEFAYVIEGRPCVWIDGKTYELQPGDFVAFPSGTGICHTFLNNTETEVKLLVGGEASKPENKIFYPLHPKRNAQMREKGWLWEDFPGGEMGDHDGLPDRLRESDADSSSKSSN